jgi:hypothetical protein
MLLLAALIFIAAYGNHVVPHSDELYLLGGKYDLNVKQYADDPTTPTPSLTLRWVWEQHAEHRIPLAKFLWLAVLKLTNYDFFVGNILVVLAFGAIAAGMILTARAVRGWTRCADAFLPLSILNFSQAMDYLWWFNVHHVLPPLLASAVLIIIVSKGTRLKFRHVLAIALCLFLLSLSGPGAFPFVLAFAVWIGYWAIHSHRSAAEFQTRWHRPLVLGLTALAVLLMGLSTIGFDRAQGMWMSGHSSGVWPYVKAALQLTSLSLGTASLHGSLWRYSGPAVTALGLGAIGLLASVWLSRPEERLRVLGVFLFLGATGVLIAGMAWARGGMGEGYIFVGHYVPRIVPAVCCIYLAFAVYGGRVTGGLIPMCLLTIACVFLWPNVTMGLNWGTSGFSYRHDLERDLRAGLPPLVLADRYARHLDHGNAENMAAVLRKLRRDKIGEFRNMQPDPLFLEIPVSVTPVLLHQVTWEEGVGYAKGNDPSLTFAMKRPERVYAIRFKLSYPSTKGQTAFLQVFWRQTGRSHFVETERNFSTGVETTREGRTVTVWVDDTIDEFRIDPDIGPCVFAISDLRLLTKGTK